MKQNKHRSPFVNHRQLTSAAMLTALSVLIGIFCKNFLNFGGGKVRLTFENLPIILAGILFGPVIGGLAGISSDMTSYLLSFQSYPPNLIVTLGAGTVGFVSGVISHYVVRQQGRTQVVLSTLLSHLIGSVIIKSIGLLQFYGPEILIIRIPLYLIVIPVETIFLCILFKNPSFQKIISHMEHPRHLPEEQPLDTYAPMDYQGALAYIHSVSGHFCKPGLERITALCDALGHPERDLKFIHVGGTNGKGSFCAMTESILRAAGYRTGLYTSPYIKEFNERMRVCGESISNEELVELTDLVRPIADGMEDKPTEFELITAIAFLYFKRHSCDVVVLEVGLGGRLDSTNIITSPLLSVVTGIDFDHTDLLGDTIEKIAAEKGGIIKEGCPVLFGGTDPAAHNTLAEIAKQRNADFFSVDRSSLKISDFSIHGTSFDFGNLTSLNLPLLGSYQPRNAATVLTAIEILNQANTLTISEDAIRQGLESVVWHARFEKLNDQNPAIFFDGSHNPEGIAAAVETVKAYFGEQKVTILTGVMRDKNYDVMIQSIGQIAHHVITVTPSNPRSLPAAEYAEHFQSRGIVAQGCTSVEEGARIAIATAQKHNTPLVCLGSLYLYGELTDAIEKALKGRKI